MIDLTSLPPNPKNKDKIRVICEKCLKPREQLYQVAKRKSEHVCMSCTKKQGEYATNELVEYVCVGCGDKKVQQYRRDRFKDWRCHHCAMVQGHKEGKFVVVHNVPSEEGKKKIAENAKKNWNDPAYREKWGTTRASTKEKRSAFSKSLWEDQERVQKLSASLRAAWEDEDYRTLKTKQSQDFWTNADYVRKQAAGMNTESVKAAMALARANQPRISAIQKTLYDYLRSFSIEFHEESEKTAIGYYVFDCMIPKQGGMHKHLLIECQGDYWHSLPQAKSKDKSKFTYVSRYFPDHEVMYVWEHEFYTKDRVLDRLKLKLGINIETVDFDFKDVEVREVTGPEVKSFLDSYHYIGKGRGGKCFGAFLNGELIGCVVYSDLIRQNLPYVGATELARFCIHPSYHKRNFASWLVSRTFKSMKKAGFRTVVSYADTTVGHTGAIYLALGFKHTHDVPSDYWYIDKEGYAMHKKSLYNRACRMSMKENEFAEKHGYVRKYGGPKKCFVREL